MTAIPLASAILVSFAFTAGTVAAQEPTKRDNPPTTSGESKDLQLKLRDNQSYAFRVTCERAGDTSATSRPGTTQPSQPGERKPAETPPPGVSGSVASSPAFRLTYQLTSLRTSPSGERTISAMIDAADMRSPMDAMPPAGEKPPGEKPPGEKPPGEKPPGEKPPGDKADDRTDKANDTSVDKAQRAEEILGRDREARKVVTLKLDAKGNITSFEGLEDLRGAMRTGDVTLDAAVVDHVTAHLALITGSGLHGVPLEIGKAYSLAGVKNAGAISGDASKGAAGTDGTAGRAKTETDKMSGDKAMCDAKLRFDGVSGNTARFSIVETGTGDRTLGQATYDTTDGLMESLTAVIGDSSAPGATPPARPIGSGLRVTIHRMGDNVTEPPR